VSRRGKIDRDPNGNWWIRLDVAPAGAPRKQMRRRGFRTKRDAQAALNELLHDLGKGTFVATDRITVAEYLAGWVEALPTQGLRPRTVASYADTLRLHVVPTLGDGRLQALTAVDLDRLYARLLADGHRYGHGGLSARSVRYVHTILRKALADAERKGLVQRNVANLASPPSAKAAKAPEASTWTAEQLRAFLDAVAEHEHYALFHVAGHTGMRRGELLGLAWADVDTDAGTVRVRHQLGLDGELVAVKTERSRRIVDLDDETVAVLRGHRKATAERRLAIGSGWIETGLVFVGVDGRALRPDAATKAFASAVARSGLPRIRFHDLRHSRASHLARAGAHPVVIQTQLGHSSATFSQEVYTHVDRDRARAAAKAVGELLAGT
jgi:integrase